MKIKVKPGFGILGMKLGEGDAARKVFITPWGCFLDAPKAAPKDFAGGSAAYEVDAGPCAALISAAVAAKHKGLMESVEILSEAKAPAKTPASAPV